MTKRAVAFLDILGFKNLLEENGSQAIFSKYKNAIEHVPLVGRPSPISGRNFPSLFPNHALNKDYCIIKIFSDSIIVVSEDESFEETFKVIYFCWRLFQLFLTNGFLLRGGISYGDMQIDKNLDIFLGDALTKSYKLENSQQWSGISIDETIEHNFPNFQKIFDSNNIVSRYNVPLKDGSFKIYPTINWRHSLVLKNGTKHFFKIRENHDSSTKQKILNTLSYAKEMRDRGCYWINEEKAPIETRTFFFGDTEPPFDHGDEY